MQSWRVPFIVIVGIALVTFIFGFVSISSYNTTKETKLDKRSVIYSTLGFGLMLYAFSSAGNLGFLTQLFLFTFNKFNHHWHFVKRQITISNPLLNLKIFNNKIFCFSTITSMIIMLSMVGPALLIPLYVQNAFRIICVAIRISNYAWRDYQWYYVCVYRKVLR